MISPWSHRLLHLFGPPFWTYINVYLPSLTQETRCRAYLAVVKSNGGQELNLLLPSVVLTLSAIYNSTLVAVQQVRSQNVLGMHEHPTAAMRP